MTILIVSIVAFTFGFIGSIPLTGPIAAMVLSASVQQRHGVAVRIGLGAALAEAIYAAVAFWGFSTFLADHPVILSAANGVSALVLAALGVYFMRWRPIDDPGTAREDDSRGFLLGFTVSILNPTLIATWSAAVAYLYGRQLAAFTPFDALPFGISAGAGVAAWEILLVALLRRYGSRFPRRALTWLIRCMGMLLVVMAVSAGIDFVRAFQHP